MAALIVAIECANLNASDDVINLTDGDDYLLTATHNTLNDDNGLPFIFPASISGTLTINGNGATISGNGERRILYMLEGAHLTLTDLTLTAGFTPSSGGAIVGTGTLNLIDVIISHNDADDGGGIYFSEGVLTLTDSTLYGNEATEDGGGILIANVNTSATLTDTTVSHNAAGIGGGGIYTLDSTFNLNNSAVHDNNAQSGGGINNYGGTLTLNGSTIAHNEASSMGGGMVSVGFTTLNNSTIAGNTASTYGGVVNNYELTLNNSIVYGNTNTDCYSALVPVESSHSMIGTPADCDIDAGASGNLVGVDPMLGALTTAPNGTAYYPLLAGSRPSTAAKHLVRAHADRSGRKRPHSGRHGRQRCV